MCCGRSRRTAEDFPPFCRWFLLSVLRTLRAGLGSAAASFSGYHCSVSGPVTPVLSAGLCSFPGKGAEGSRSQGDRWVVSDAKLFFWWITGHMTQHGPAKDHLWLLLFEPLLKECPAKHSTWAKIIFFSRETRVERCTSHLGFPPGFPLRHEYRLDWEEWYRHWQPPVTPGTPYIHPWVSIIAYACSSQLYHGMAAAVCSDVSTFKLQFILGSGSPLSKRWASRTNFKAFNLNASYASIHPIPSSNTPIDPPGVEK